MLKDHTHLSAALALGVVAGPGLAAGVAAGQAAPAKGRTPFRQGLTRLVLGGADVSVEECCRRAAELGAKGIDFLCGPGDFETLARHGLVCSMVRADPGGLQSDLRRVSGPPGWHAIGEPEAQGAYLSAIERAIDIAAEHGAPNLILLAGTRDRVSYEQGADHAVAFCKRIAPRAEAKGVTLCIENLNSLGMFAPPNSLFDRAAWGFDVVARTGSPRVKVLYDLFHAQLVDGNLAATLRKHIGAIGHIHVGGVPGRHQLDESQELNYRFIGRVIAETGFSGFVTHEWFPMPGTPQPLEVVRRSMALIAGEA